jgi:hypothetical protein
MRNGIRIDQDGPAINKGRRGGPKVSTPDPNDLLIQLELSAIRQAWTHLGRRNRHAMGEYRVRSLEPLDPHLSRMVSESD